MASHHERLDRMRENKTYISYKRPVSAFSRKGGFVKRDISRSGRRNTARRNIRPVSAHVKYQTERLCGGNRSLFKTGVLETKYSSMTTSQRLRRPVPASTFALSHNGLCVSTAPLAPRLYRNGEKGKKVVQSIAISPRHIRFGSHLQCGRTYHRKITIKNSGNQFLRYYIMPIVHENVGGEGLANPIAPGLSKDLEIELIVREYEECVSNTLKVRTESKSVFIEVSGKCSTVNDVDNGAEKGSFGIGRVFGVECPDWRTLSDDEKEDVLLIPQIPGMVGVWNAGSHQLEIKSQKYSDISPELLLDPNSTLEQVIARDQFHGMERLSPQLSQSRAHRKLFGKTLRLKEEKEDAVRGFNSFEFDDISTGEIKEYKLNTSTIFNQDPSRPETESIK